MPIEIELQIITVAKLACLPRRIIVLGRLSRAQSLLNQLQLVLFSPTSGQRG